MIDFSGRAARAGTRGIAVVAAASSFVVMSQLAPQEHARAGTGARTVRKHDHDTTRHDQGRNEARGDGRRHADLVVDTEGGPQGAVLPGRTYKWPYQVTNRGSVPAKDVALTATPDKSLKILAIPPRCVWRRSSRLICRIGLLPRGETRRGVITASVAPKATVGRALTSPVQVSWRNAPEAGLRTSLPAARIYPAGKGADQSADRYGLVPYPVMQVEHGPGTAEAVVVRSPIAPCAGSVLPARVIGGRTNPIKPNCGLLPNTPAPVPAVAELGQDAAPCSALTPGKNAHERPVTTPCAAGQDPCACGTAAAQGRPVADKTDADTSVDKAANDKAAADKAAADKAAADKAANDKAATDKAAAEQAAGSEASRPVDAAHGHPVADQPANAIPGRDADKAASRPADHTATTPGTSADQTAGVPAGASGVVIVPGRPSTLPCRTVVDRPIAEPNRPAVAPCGSGQVPAATGDADHPARPGEHAAPIAPERPAAAPCGVVESPGVAQDRPVVPPCAAQGLPGACSCLASPDARPAAAQGAPVTATVPNRPAVTVDRPGDTPDRPGAAPCAAKDASAPAPCVNAAQNPEAGDPNEIGAAPCGAADKPMAADDDVLPGKSAPPSCASVRDRPIATPVQESPITPLAGVGKAAHRPIRPVHEPGVRDHVPALRDHAESLPRHAPHRLGHGRRACVRQGTGFICPLGAVPPGRSHPVRPVLHSHPHRMRCTSSDVAGCHVRMAHPVTERFTARRLPTTGTSSALLALGGLGLAGAGVACYRIGRARRSES